MHCIGVGVSTRAHNAYRVPTRFAPSAREDQRQVTGHRTRCLRPSQTASSSSSSAPASRHQIPGQQEDTVSPESCVCRPADPSGCQAKAAEGAGRRGTDTLARTRRRQVRLEAATSMNPLTSHCLALKKVLGPTGGPSAGGTITRIFVPTSIFLMASSNPAGQSSAAIRVAVCRGPKARGGPEP